jgi:hypothetical protein
VTKAKTMPSPKAAAITRLRTLTNGEISAQPLLDAEQMTLAKIMLPTGTWTNYALCKQHGCNVNAVPFAPDPPYRLYAIDTKTGAMS